MSFSGPIAISGLGATKEEVEEDSALSTTHRSVVANYDYYMALAPQAELPVKDGTILPDDAIQWGKQALNNFEAREGKTSSSSFKGRIATADGFKGLRLTDVETAEYASVLGEISGAAGNQYYDAGATAAVLTADSLRDGKFSQDEAENMGTAIGAVAGAVIGQAVGIPAPIGAVVGGLVGGGSAAIIHNVFAAPSANKMAKVREARVRKELNAFRHDATAACDRFDLEYWEQVEDFLRSFAIAWTDAELQMGWRFGLRWFDPTSEPSFRYKWDKDKQRSRVSQGIRTDTRASYDCDRVTLSTTQGTKHDQWCTSRCSFVYGCPYPDLYQGVSGGPTPHLVVDAALENGFRAVHALAARGILWIPEQRLVDWQRPECRDYIYAPQQDAYEPSNAHLRVQYRDDIRGRLENLDAQYRQFIRARTWLQADLTRTIAVVGSEHDMWVNKSRYITDGATGGAVAEAKRQRKLTRDFLTGAALIGGGSLLGYALYRGLK